MYCLRLIFNHVQGQAATLKHAERGRSMIEMIGVLAIVGILSIVGIAGYQQAMFKYKTNNFSAAYTTLLSNIFEYHDSFKKWKLIPWHQPWKK